MKNSLLFPPHTKEGQFDEKWSFDGKKEKNCDPDNPADERYGDIWDHVALDPEHRLVLSVVPGKRTAENAHQVVKEFKKKTDGRMMSLLTSDMHKPYESAILEEYGVLIVPTHTGLPGRPKKSYRIPPEGLNYAIVKKTLKQGKIEHVETKIVFGNQKDVNEALKNSKASKNINTSFIERQNGTDRNRNARKVRKTLCFSKEPEQHNAMTYFTMYSYNFCWPVRTLREQENFGEKSIQYTPAMSAGLTDHIWSMEEWAKFPAVQSY